MMKEKDVLAQIEGLTVTRLRICIEEAWVRPARDTASHVFDDLDVARLRLISELTEDMAVNDDAVPIILSLIDQIHSFRRQLRALEQAVSAQGDAVRADVAALLRDMETR
jgi:chaperone modulatory protein CbpM